jgi:AraC family transcriptional regulator
MVARPTRNHVFKSAISVRTIAIFHGRLATRNATMQNAREQAYAKRFNRVFDFIERHLGDELSIKQLARVARFSTFHFHRQFTHYVGVTPTRYVQLARMRRASYRLAFNPLERVTDIAEEACFENSESFSRAFKKTFGQSPSAFRKTPDWASWSKQFHSKPPRGLNRMQVKIVDFEPVTVAVLEHRGDPTLLNGSVQRFIAWRKESGLSPIASSRTYGIPYHDPATTPAKDFRFDICGSVSGEVPSNKRGIVTKIIPGGRCAVVRHEGSPDNISESVYYLYRNWLPRSGEELSEFPVIFHYLNLKSNAPEHELLTDVHLPLK